MKFIKLLFILSLGLFLIIIGPLKAGKYFDAFLMALVFPFYLPFTLIFIMIISFFLKKLFRMLFLISFLSCLLLIPIAYIIPVTLLQAYVICNKESLSKEINSVLHSLPESKHQNTIRLNYKMFDKEFYPIFSRWKPFLLIKNDAGTHLMLWMVGSPGGRKFYGNVTLDSKENILLKTGTPFFD